MHYRNVGISMVRRSLAIGLPIGILLFAPTLLGPSNLPSTASCRPFDQLALAKLPVSWETAGGIKFQERRGMIGLQDQIEVLCLKRLTGRLECALRALSASLRAGPLHVDVRGQEYGSTWRLASRTASVRSEVADLLAGRIGRSPTCRQTLLTRSTPCCVTAVSGTPHVSLKAMRH